MAKTRTIPLVLVCLYEVGVRLKQTSLLLRRHTSPSAGGVAGVRQALTLLCIAFDSLFAAAPMAAWKRKVEATLEGAEQDYEVFTRSEEDFDQPLSVVTGRVQELTRLAQHCADLAAVTHPGAADWLRLGQEVVRDWHDADQSTAALEGLLGVVGVEHRRLLPDVDETRFPDDFLDLHEEFQDWHAVEAGLKALRHDAASPKTATSPTSLVGAWCHKEDETPPAEYPHGPLRGTLKALGKAAHPQGRGDSRYLEKLQQKKRVWVKKITGHHYEMYFATQGDYERAAKKLAAQGGAK